MQIMRVILNGLQSFATPDILRFLEKFSDFGHSQMANDTLEVTGSSPVSPIRRKSLLNACIAYLPLVGSSGTKGRVNSVTDRNNTGGLLCPAGRSRLSLTANTTRQDAPTSQSLVSEVILRAAKLSIPFPLVLRCDPLIKITDARHNLFLPLGLGRSSENRRDRWQGFLPI